MTNLSRSTLAVFSLAAMTLLRAEACGSSSIDCKNSRITMSLSPGESDPIIEGCDPLHPAYYSPDQYTISGYGHWPTWLSFAPNGATKQMVVSVADDAPVGSNAEVIVSINPKDSAPDPIPAHQIQLVVNVIGPGTEWVPQITSTDLYKGYVALVNRPVTLKGTIAGDSVSPADMQVGWTCDSSQRGACQFQPDAAGTAGQMQRVFQPTSMDTYTIGLSATRGGVTRTATKQIAVVGAVPIITPVSNMAPYYGTRWDVDAGKSWPVPGAGDADPRQFSWSAQVRDSASAPWRAASPTDCVDTSDPSANHRYFGCSATHYQIKVKLDVQLAGLAATSTSSVLLVNVTGAPDK